MGGGDNECVVCVDGYEIVAVSSVIRLKKSGGAKVEERVTVGSCSQIAQEAVVVVCNEGQFKY